MVHDLEKTEAFSIKFIFNIDFFYPKDLERVFDKIR